MATKKKNASKTKASVRTKKESSPAKTKKSMAPIANPDAETETTMNDQTVQGKSHAIEKHDWDQ